MIQWIYDYKTQAHGILNPTQFLFCWIGRADISSTHRRSCKFHLFILHNSLSLKLNFSDPEKSEVSFFDIRFIKYLFVHMYHTHMHVCMHPCSLCCHFTIAFYIKTVKVLWIISDGSEYPLRLRASQSFWKPKASHFNSFENPWHLALNFNQEKLYLINNGIC